MRAAPARRRGRWAKVATYPVEALTGGGALGVPAALLALGGGGDLGMRRPLGSRGGLPCPRRPRGSSGANGASPFDARQGPRHVVAWMLGCGPRISIAGSLGQ